MYESLRKVTLKDGESVDVGVVVGPDADWADRVEALLGHKGEMWRWGNEMVLRQDLGIGVYFYILHRDGVPFANMMTLETNGVGVFGHVFTKGEDRRKHAASLLMGAQMDHFRSRGGRALYLGTGYDSAAYHIYRSHGFVGLEPMSGSMDYYAEGREAFEAWCFADGDIGVERLTWVHGPASPSSFVAEPGGAVRSCVMRIFGRHSTEGGILGLLRDEQVRREKGLGARTAAAVNRDTQMVVGLATWGRDPLWPHTMIVDVHCHSDHWRHAGDLLSGMEIPEAGRVVAYADVGWAEKEAALSDAGFEPGAVTENRTARNAARTEFVNVREWVKR